MTTSAEIEHPDCISHLLSHELLSELSRHFTILMGVGVGFIDRDGVKIVITNPNQDFCASMTGENVELMGYCRMTREKLAVLHETVVASQKLMQDEITHHTCMYGFRYSVAAVLLEGDPIGYCFLGPYIEPDYELPAGELIKKMDGIGVEQIERFFSGLKPLQRKQAGSMLQSVLGTVDIVNSYAYKVQVASQMQHISMEENYRILLEKNRELQETKIRLEELDRLKSNILSTISHELRTPLTSIIGYSDMLLGQSGESLTDDQKKFVQTINEKGGALLNMINKILDVASIESGRFELSKEKYPVNKLIESAIDRIRAESSRLDVKIEYGKSDEPILVYGDPSSIEKAIYHVIDNAVKFSPPAGVVQVQMRRVNPESESPECRGFVIMAPALKSVEIMVRDFGTGIADEMKEKIFEPFFQSDDATTRTYGGLGLGLALVKQYVWANHGQIFVESQEGMGSTFYIRLPVQD
jgi:two-component system sensor histidine kinase BarA